MNFFARLRGALVFLKITPSDIPVEWTENDALELQAYMNSESGAKLTLYMRGYCLRQQDAAISNTDNLKFNAGACNGSKAVLAQLSILAEPKNFTAEDTLDHEVP